MENQPKKYSFPLNNIGNWQENEKNVEFPLSIMENWQIMKETESP